LLPGAHSAPHRTGKAPKCLFIFSTVAPRGRVMTARYWIGEHECQVEVLGTGNQFVAFGTHPDTGRDYEWANGSPLDVPFAELPILDPETINTFLSDAETVLAAAGRPVKESKPDRKRRQSGDGTFWTRVNSAALADPERWVPELFPSARQEAGTGAWRVTSQDLGRTLEEDISIHPDGIRDFGGERPETPINLVVEYGGAPTTKDAALWLCERLGVFPAELGWELRACFGNAGAAYEGANDNERPDGETSAEEPNDAPDGEQQQASAAKADNDLLPVDLWAQRAHPPLPVDLLPPVIETFARPGCSDGRRSRRTGSSRIGRVCCRYSRPHPVTG
jgi:hypothetical protein